MKKLATFFGRIRLTLFYSEKLRERKFSGRGVQSNGLVSHITHAESENLHFRKCDIWVIAVLGIPVAFSFLLLNVVPVINLTGLEVFKKIEGSAGEIQELGMALAEIVDDVGTEVGLSAFVSFVDNDEVPVIVKNGVLGLIITAPRSLYCL